MKSSSRALPAAFTVALSLLLSMSSPASAENPDAGARPVLRGWHEVVFSVADLDARVDFWSTVQGYEVIHRGLLPRGLYGEEGESLSGRSALMRNPGSATGYLRLVEFTRPGHQIRPHAQSWDTGGWFDANVRVLDLEHKTSPLLGEGWQGYSAPITFRFGPFHVREWLGRGPEGIVLAMVQRLAPTLEGWPHLRNVSRFFNATQIVRDLEASRRFYEDVLGFRPYLEHRGASAEAGPNVLGLPQNLTSEIEREVVILHPQGINQGSVELLQFHGADGTYFGDEAVAPNLGILAVRFPVEDVEALVRYLEENGSQDLDLRPAGPLEPYGETRILRVRGPNGELLEFFESSLLPVESLEQAAASTKASKNSESP